MQTICYSIPLLSLVTPTSTWLQGMTYISAVLFHKHIHFWSQFHNITFFIFLVFDEAGNFKVWYLTMLPIFKTKWHWWDKEMSSYHWWNDADWKNRSTLRISCLSANVSTIEVTWTDLGSNRGLCDARPVTNRAFSK